MKNEIKAGEYVRTKKGIIYKADQTYYLNNNIPIKFATFSDRVTKHSSNIIDLIEEGDYVNGHKILEIHEALAPDDERILDIGYGMAIFEENNHFTIW